MEGPALRGSAEQRRQNRVEAGKKHVTEERAPGGHRPGGLGLSRRTSVLQEPPTGELFENGLPGLLSLLHVARALPFRALAEDWCCIFRILQLGTAKHRVITETGIGSV